MKEIIAFSKKKLICRITCLTMGSQELLIDNGCATLVNLSSMTCTLVHTKIGSKFRDFVSEKMKAIEKICSNEEEF